ncbi:hypothetical protein JCM10908_004728 [Rhodotorula pacifica]|uniref:uncharacterized protein n=1 Tax=Rhodotorula pacifica TaxID=1495444 RepID=UPI003181D899
MGQPPAMYRLTERDGILHVDAAPSGFALERRQGPGGAAASGAASSAAGGAAAATTTSAAAATTTTAAATTTTTRPATTTQATTTAAPTTTQATTTQNTTTDETTSSAAATTTTSAPAQTTSTSSAAESSTTTTTRSTPSSAADTTVTRVITPTTVVVIGTSTFTSSLSPITSAETLSSSQTALPASSGSGLSTGAIAGIAVGSAVGGIIALSLLGWLCLGAARRRRDKRDADNILWPATGDSSALYPEPVHNTGRAGFGVGDDGDEMDEGAAAAYGKPSMSEVGAGAAGVGAAAVGAGALGRYGSQREPQLPNVPPAVYASDYGHDSYGADAYYGGDASPPEGASAYTGYSNQTPSQHSHSALAPGMAGVAYGGAAGAAAGGYERQTPSPPRFGTAGGASADGHMSAYDGESQGGHLPFPGEAGGEFESPERSLSPRPMQVGDTFGQGYDETEGGKRWRLSVVNDDPLDRD